MKIPGTKGPGNWKLREGIFPVIMRAAPQQAAGRVQTFSKQDLPAVINSRHSVFFKERIHH
jgi:hypothetical protein